MSLPTIVAGKVKVTTTLPAPATYANAMKYNAAGELYVSSAAPAGTTYAQGFRFAADGALYVSESAPQAYNHGMGFRLDGALCVSTSAQTGWSNGLPIAGGGGVAVDGLGPSASFFAPLMTTLVPTTAGNPTFTFARAALAYAMDFENILRQASQNEARFQGARRVANLVAGSTEDITASPWANQGSSTKTVNTTGLPVGAAKSTTITTTTAGNNGASQATAFVIGRTYCLSFDAKGAVGGESVWITDGNGTGAQIPVTAAWQRYSKLMTATNAQLLLLVTSAAASVTLSKIQVEAVDGQSNQAPSEYVSVGVLAAPYHGNGVDGVKYFATRNGNSVAANVVTEAAGTAIPLATMLGYVAENAATNLCLQSQTLDNATYWTPDNAAIAPDFIAAPDGTLTADRFTDNATNGMHRLYQLAMTVAASPVSFSIYAKQGTLPWIQLLLSDNTSSFWANFNLATGAVGNKHASVTAAIVALPNGWYRFTVTATTLAVATGNVHVYGSLSDFASPSPTYAGTGQTMYLWGAQVEQASDPSSYIPTTTAAVSRAVDTLQYQMVSNMDGALATTYAEVYPFAMPATLQRAVLRVSNAVKYTPYFEFDNSLGVYLPPSANFNTVNKGIARTINKCAAAWSGVTGSVCLNGGAVATGAVTVFAAVDVIRPGGGSSDVIIGCIRNVNIYATRLTDAQLIALTA